MKYLLSLFLLFSIFAPCKSQSIKLSLNLTKGNTYYMGGTSASSIIQTINGQENEIGVRLIYRIAFKVINIIDTIYTMEVRYQTMDMKITVGTKIIEMDSKRNDPHDVPSSVVSAMMNKPFTVLLSKSGKIQSISNVEKMVSGVMDDFPQINGAKKEQLKNQFLQTFGGNAFKGNLEMETAIYPMVAVTQMDKWTVNTKLQGAVKVNVKTVFHLTSVKNGYYGIHGDGKIVTENEFKTGQLNGLPVRYNISGTSISDIKVDKITGWITETKLTQIMKGDIAILNNPRVPGGMQIPMAFTTQVVTTNK